MAHSCIIKRNEVQWMDYLSLNWEGDISSAYFEPWPQAIIYITFLQATFCHADKICLIFYIYFTNLYSIYWEIYAVLLINKFRIPYETTSTWLKYKFCNFHFLCRPFIVAFSGNLIKSMLKICVDCLKYLCASIGIEKFLFLKGLHVSAGIVGVVYFRMYLFFNFFLFVISSVQSSAWASNKIIPFVLIWFGFVFSLNMRQLRYLFTPLRVNALLIVPTNDVIIVKPIYKCIDIHRHTHAEIYRYLCSWLKCTNRRFYA